MNAYKAQVRYNQAGEIKSIVHTEMAKDVVDASMKIVSRLSYEVAVFNININDRFIIKSSHVLNVALIGGEE